MQLPLQITCRDVELTPAEEASIRESAAKLESFWDRITSCRVVVTMPRRRGRTGQHYNVRIDVKVPGAELVIRRQAQERLLDAVQDAFRAAARRVQDQARKTRGVPPRRGAPRGTVTRLLPWEGYGFITTADDREVYFDRNSVIDGGFDRIEEGMSVRFAEAVGTRGPQASTVAPVPRTRPAKRAGS
jgi:cold shock CspA family protein/ribosome-associated translation inhibitor RaiA